MQILIGADHAGKELAAKLSVWLFDINYSVKTFFPINDINVDYPDYAHKTCKSISGSDVGILVCGTGVGMAIAANRFKHIRCVNSHDIDIIRLSRQHNNSNVLSLGARFIDEETAWKCVKIFIHTSFEGGRHQTRIDKLYSNHI